MIFDIAKEKWLESFEADQERINDDLKIFDKRLNDFDK